jgi:uncharacterized cupin superfamily protein
MPTSEQAALEQRNVRSFVDLRKFASDESRRNEPNHSGDVDGFLSSRRFLDWPAGPLSAGVLTLDAGSGLVPPQPVDEFLIVAEGEIALKQEGARELTMRPGDSAVLGCGVAFSWSAKGPVSIVFMRYQRGRCATGRIVPIEPAPNLEPSGTPPAELLLSPVPACRNFTDYRSDDGAFVCGTWDSTAYQRSALFYGHCELMYLLEGRVTFVDESGRTATFERGDIFLIEQGARCSWDSREHVAKVYAIYRPA